MSYEDRKLQYFERRVKELSKRANTTVEDAIAEAKKDTEEAYPAYFYDKTFYRNLIALLSIITLAVVIGVIYLLALDKTPSDGLIAIGSAAVGALVGIFSVQKKEG